MEFSSFFAIEKFTYFCLTYFNNGFMSVIISMYFSFIPVIQVTFSVHSNMVLIGGLSFIWFVLSDSTLMR